MTPHTKVLGSDYERLYDLFLRFNRRLLSILTLLKPPLSTSSSHLLSELYSNPTSVARDLTSRLLLPKGTVSRTVSSLKSQGLLKITPSKKDRRFKNLQLTGRGRRTIEEDLDIRNREIALCVEPLTTTQRRELETLLRLIADELEAPAFTGRTHDSPLLQQIRRLTRSMGFIGDNCLGTELPREYCQVLHLALSEGGLGVQEGSHRISIEVSDFSRRLKELEGLKLIKRETHGSDHRRVIVRLTEKGKRQAQRNVENGREFFRKALKRASPSQVQRLISLLDQFLFVPMPNSLSLTNSHWEFVKLSGDVDFVNARRFMIAAISKNEAYQVGASTLISPANSVYAIIDRGTMKGVVEIAPKYGHTWEVVNIAVAADLRRSRAAVRLLVFALDSLKRMGKKVNEVLLPNDSYSYWITGEEPAPEAFSDLKLDSTELHNLVASLS